MYSRVKPKSTMLKFPSIINLTWWLRYWRSIASKKIVHNSSGYDMFQQSLFIGKHYSLIMSKYLRLALERNYSSYVPGQLSVHKIIISTMPFFKLSAALNSATKIRILFHFRSFVANFLFFSLFLKLLHIFTTLNFCGGLDLRNTSFLHQVLES